MGGVVVLAYKGIPDNGPSAVRNDRSWKINMAIQKVKSAARQLYSGGHSKTADKPQGQRHLA
jgi:hypothetical protein